MFKTLYALTYKNYMLLYRGKAFFPVFLFALVCMVFSLLMSSWGVNEFRKIFFDSSMFFFHIFGNAAALFWGIKLLLEARQEGSMEVELAAPISRSLWLLGIYLGLSATLLLLSGISLTLWEGFFYVHFGRFSTYAESLVAFVQVFGFLVSGAIAVFFASFCGLGVALFASFSLWISGLMTYSLYELLGRDQPLWFHHLASFLAKVWNLQYFNPSLEHSSFSLALYSGLYALSLIVFLLTASSLLFQKRDAIF